MSIEQDSPANFVGYKALGKRYGLSPIGMRLKMNAAGLFTQAGEPLADLLDQGIVRGEFVPDLSNLCEKKFVYRWDERRTIALLEKNGFARPSTGERSQILQDRAIAREKRMSRRKARNILAEIAGQFEPAGNELQTNQDVLFGVFSSIHGFNADEALSRSEEMLKIRKIVSAVAGIPDALIKDRRISEKRLRAIIEAKPAIEAAAKFLLSDKGRKMFYPI